MNDYVVVGSLIILGILEVMSS